jgi:hypothetical protein
MKTNAGVWNELQSKYGDKIELMEDRWDWNQVDWQPNK